MLTGGGRGSSHCLRKQNFQKIKQKFENSCPTNCLYVILIPDIYFGGDKCRNFDDFAHLVPKIISAEIYLRRIIAPACRIFISAEFFHIFFAIALGIQLNLIKYKFYPSVVLKISIMNADSDRLKFKLAE